MIDWVIVVWLLGYVLQALWFDIRVWWFDPIKWRLRFHGMISLTDFQRQVFYLAWPIWGPIIIILTVVRWCRKKQGASEGDGDE